MSKVAIKGNASGTGTFTIAAPNSNTDRTLTLPDEAGTVLTSGGAIDVNASAPADSVAIDSSGNLLVGNTEATPHNLTSGGGFSVRGALNVLLSVARQDNECALFNRTNTDGSIVEFLKDGTTVGSISSIVGAGISYNGTSGVIKIGGDQSNHIEVLTSTATGAPRLQPSADNTVDLGLNSRRFDDIYATNGTIQTSDRNEKQDIEELSEAEQRVAVAAKALMRKFRWKDAVAEKGDDARIHFGIIAQDLQAAFEAEGLDAGRYAMFISSTWWEAEETYTDDEGVERTRINTYDTAEEAPEGAVERTRLGVRYPELLAFIIGAL